jgi:FkbM family methyltransferase
MNETRLNPRSMVQILKKFGKRLFQGKYFSLNQLDQKLERYVDYDDGYFVELGANDGVTQSNSLYFEKHRGWRGVLVEPAPQNFLKCRQNRSGRSSIYCAACVSFDYDQEFVRIAYSNLMSTPISLESDIQDPRAHAYLGDRFLGQDETMFEFGAVARPLNSLLQDAGAPRQIDFLSLDVEGAELEVLKGVDHEAFRFKFILVECRDFTKLNAYLESKGYRFVEKLSSQDYLFTSDELSKSGASSG